MVPIAAVGMLTLLIAAISEKKRGQCTDYKITIKSADKSFFIDEKDVYKLLAAATGGSIKGQPISAINIRKLEAMLENSVWINDAQLYFDNTNTLHVSVVERHPFARVFTGSGSSFYIDSMEKRMPLSERKSGRVPVFTGFPDKKNLAHSDSLLLHDIKTVATFIQSNPFWLSQASEFDITPDRNFEMVPVVGNHIIRIGDAQNLDQKFHRLFLFYKNVLSKTGFDKYKVIDAQYDGQIVAVRKGEKSSSVDTTRLKSNVQKLIRQSLEMQNDTMVTAKPVVRPVSLNSEDRALMNGSEEDITKSSSPNPLKLSDKKSVPVKKNGMPAVKNEPKAVMKKRNQP
jgi:cell division protein FtsQ